MDFLKTIQKRSVWSEVLYIALNVGLAIALMIIIRTTNSLWLAFVLVLLSKWRVFAIRPRFWFAHLQANAVDMTVGFSFAVFLYVTNQATATSTQILLMEAILTFFYILWLVLLKAQSKRIYMVAQAGIALFTGITALYLMSPDWIVLPVVLLAGIIGHVAAAHIFSSYDDETHSTLLSLIWGLLVAQISWIAYYWTIAYRLPFFSEAKIPQISIILLCFGFLSYKVYDSYYHYQKIRRQDVLLPGIFSVAIVIVLLLAFSGVNVGSI